MKDDLKPTTFLGLTFQPLQIQELSKAIAESPTVRGVSYHFVNSYSIVCASRSSLVHQAYSQGFLVCDGKPLNLVLRRSKNDFPRVRGADFMRIILRDQSSKNRHFFLGSTQDVLEDLIIQAKKNNDRLDVAGFYAPPFKEDLSGLATEIALKIADSKATCVWVGLGTPKQDVFSAELARILNVHVFAVGAAFDFLAGQKMEAPFIFQKLGLEWLFRLVLEPRRLGKRYLVGNLQFLKIVVLDSIPSLNKVIKNN
jgi:N-acetylglucosaminyldiphosphoundecaprenol N-acetyl-beta-D-mannosaminyltransferase